MLPDISHDIFRLVVCRIELAEFQLLAVPVVRPQGLILTPAVIADDRVGSIQNVAGRAIVLLQLDHFSILEHMLKIQDILDIGSPELIDRLVVIAYYAQVAVLRSQQPDQFKLDRIRILILIHHDITETFLVIFQHICLRLEELDRLNKKVIKIQGIVGPQLLLIFLIHLSDLLLAEIAFCTDSKFFRRNQFILGMRDGAKQSSFLKNLRINLKQLAYVFHQRLLVIAVINGKVIIIAQQIDMSSEDPHASGMERAYPDALRAESYQFVHTLPHLACRLVGKGYSQYIPGIYSLLFYQICDSVGQHSGLSRACPGKYQKRAFCMKHRLFLLFIQCIVYTQSSCFLSSFLCFIYSCSFCISS